jgi:ADP-heptose:LPS heptosyltransferase
MQRTSGLVLNKLNVRRIVVLRALQLGDLLCAVPALRALRAAAPDAEIVLIGLPWARQFVNRFGHYVDGFREFPGFPGLPERAPLIDRFPAFLAEIQRERFDLAIQLHGSGSHVNSLTVLLGARACAGFFSPPDYCPDADRFMPWPRRGLEIHRLLGLMEFLGAKARGEHLEFPLTADDMEQFRHLPESRELIPGKYICIHSGASTPVRRWPIERFAAVARVLLDRGSSIVLTGTAEESEICRSLASELDYRCINLAGRTSPGSMGILLDRARLLVTNDTGVSHIAAALKVPSVVISTGDNPARWAPIDSSRHRVLCRDTGVDPDDVLTAAVELLEWHSFERATAVSQ